MKTKIKSVVFLLTEALNDFWFSELINEIGSASIELQFDISCVWKFKLQIKFKRNLRN